MHDPPFFGVQGDFIFHLPNIIEACTKISLALGRAVHVQAQSKVMIQQKLTHCLKGKEELLPIALTEGPELLFWKEKKSKVTSCASLGLDRKDGLPPPPTDSAAHRSSQPA